MKIFRKYGFIGSLRLIRDLVFTKLFFRKCRIVRMPFYIRGTDIDFGTGLTTGVGLRIDIIGDEKYTKLIIGKNVQINDYVHIGAAIKIKIDDNCLIGSKVLITDHNHGIYSGNNQSLPKELMIKRKICGAEIFIKKNVWIGENVAILPGVTIGENSIIACNSVVKYDIPPNTIAAGSPAKPVKKWSNEINKWVRCD